MKNFLIDNHYGRTSVLILENPPAEVQKISIQFLNEQLKKFENEDGSVQVKRIIELAQVLSFEKSLFDNEQTLFFK